MLLAPRLGDSGLLTRKQSPSDFEAAQLLLGTSAPFGARVDWRYRRPLGQRSLLNSGQLMAYSLVTCCAEIVGYPLSVNSCMHVLGQSPAFSATLPAWSASIECWEASERGNQHHPSAHHVVRQL